MLPIILSDRLRGELEALLAQTPSAKEWCRARALLWLAEGGPAAEVAELLLVSRQSVFKWAGGFDQREDFALRARLLDAPRSGRPPTASGVIDPLIAEVIDKDPREMGYHSTNWTASPLVHYLKQAIQRPGGARRGDAPDDLRDQRRLHQLRVGLCAAAGGGGGRCG